MGRQVRRVPVDFDWPLNKRWTGFLMPDELLATPCPDCGEAGQTAARLWVEQITRLLLLLDEDLRAQSLGRDMHPYLRDTGTRAWNVRPSADIAEFGTGLAGREPSFMGHDSLDAWRATSKVIQAAGLDPETWGICPTCAGHGTTETYPGQSVEAGEWRPTEPPTGDGWQLWETVSEGSPISPVFPDAEGLARWMASPAYTWGISHPMQYDAALRFVLDGSAPSMVVGSASGGLVPGEQWVADRNTERRP